MEWRVVVGWNVMVGVRVGLDGVEGWVGVRLDGVDGWVGVGLDGVEGGVGLGWIG